MELVLTGIYRHRLPMYDVSGYTLGKPKAMENQNPPQLIHKSTDQVGNWIKLSMVWTVFIVPQIGLLAFKHKPGENPLFNADHVGVFGLLGLSLNVYIITSVVLSLMKTPTPPTSRLPILVLHVCWSCGALTCGILSSLLFNGWIIFCFYALFLWVAPCNPLRILRWLRPPSNTQQHLDAIDPVLVEELPMIHPTASTFDMQEYSGSSTSSLSSSDEDFENPQVWKYI